MVLHKPLPVGVENFEKMINSGYFYIDKTLFIKELIKSLNPQLCWGELNKQKRA